MQLEELAKQITDYDYLAFVPGVGEATIVELLSEIGSFTQYEHPRQLIKLAGLTDTQKWREPLIYQHL